MKKKTVVLATILFLPCLVILAGVSWLWGLNTQVKEGLAKKNFLPPTEYYENPEILRLQGSLLKRDDLRTMLLKRKYREREWNQNRLAGDFSIGTSEQCPPQDQTHSCLQLTLKSAADPDLLSFRQQTVFFDSQDQALGAISATTPHLSQELFLDGALIGQYLDKQPISQKYHSLGEFPPACLNAVLAIEDSKFLEHSGFSYTGFARAILSHTVGIGVKQGGSTITQQLVKNYFLTAEKTLKRKLIEFFMSLILETHSSKDEILETYLNIIYMGQNGPFQIRGFGSASQYYFDKPIDQLEVPECALLAAVLNSPGLFDPFKKPENALKRRGLVLEKMQELGFISLAQKNSGQSYPLPFEKKSTAFETAPYYIDLVQREAEALGISIGGKKIYTGLDLTAQAAAQTSIKEHLERLENDNAKIKSLKEKGHHLESALIAVNNQSGLYSAVVGGRNFRMTQFNRAIDGHRQIGSIMKPIVFLTALIHDTDLSPPFDPLFLLKDESFTHRYENQKWTPENYGKKYFGEVPAYFALKNSLNAATASLGLQIGLGPIIETARLLGVQSDLSEVPAMTLGAFELYPTEVAQAYTTIARMGNFIPLHSIRAIADEKDTVLYQFQTPGESRISASATASLVSMMKQTTLTGTARSVASAGLMQVSAGKTGTTSDNKDTWFAGFTPDVTSVVWVGYDTPQITTLTGASGALPIWIQFMKKHLALFPPNDDFSWPADVTTKDITDEDGNSVSLVFKENP